MPTEWQTHLTEYKARHPELSLKECMQNASQSYRGASKKPNKSYRGVSKPEKKPEKKSKRNETKVVLQDVIGLSKSISHVTDSLSEKEVKNLKQVVEKLQNIYDSHFSDDDSESDSESASDASE